MIARTNIGGAAFLIEPPTAGDDARVYYAEQLSLRVTSSTGGTTAEYAVNAALAPELSRKLMKNGTVRAVMDVKCHDSTSRMNFFLFHNGVSVGSTMPGSGNNNWYTVTRDIEVSAGDIIELRYATTASSITSSFKLSILLLADFSNAGIVQAV